MTGVIATLVLSVNSVSFNAANANSPFENLNVRTRRDDIFYVNGKGVGRENTSWQQVKGTRPGRKDISATNGLLPVDGNLYDVPAALLHIYELNQRRRGDDSMHEHGPDELQGPVRGTTAWWRGTAAEPATDDGTPVEDQPRNKSKKDAKPIRMELVERIRKEIAAGTYDTQEKWEAALDRMLDRLENDD